MTPLPHFLNDLIRRSSHFGAVVPPSARGKGRKA